MYGCCTTTTWKEKVTKTRSTYNYTTSQMCNFTNFLKIILYSFLCNYQIFREIGFSSMCNGWRWLSWLILHGKNLRFVVTNKNNFTILEKKLGNKKCWCVTIFNVKNTLFLGFPLDSFFFFQIFHISHNKTFIPKS